jgi:voltage-gated potassium channel
MSKITLKAKTYEVDEYGVKNYNTFYLLTLSLLVLYGSITLLAFPLVHYESLAPNANITSYKDAFWALQMSASTIGFGDFYPVTFEGRLIVAIMFYIGVGLVGFIGAQLVNKFVGFSDTNVKNRELRKQNAAILEHNKQLEVKIDQLIATATQLLEQQKIVKVEQQEIVEKTSAIKSETKEL